MSTYVDGIGASQNIDSSGEIVDIAGLDISSLEIDGSLNWEHKKDVPEQLVGKVLKAKKIFSIKDCEDDRQKYFWHKCNTPYLYILGELFDDYVDSARHVAGLFRYDADHRGKNERDIIGFSVEGAKLPGAVNGMTITRSIARKITITNFPCNKMATAEMVPATGKKPKDNLDNIFKTESYVEIEVFPGSPKSNVWDLLKKEAIKIKTSILSGKPMKKDIGAGGLAYGSSTGLSGSGPTSPSLSCSEPDMARSEEIKKAGVHEPARGGMHPGRSDAGLMATASNNGRSPLKSGGKERQASAARQMHSRKLTELKNMPKPNLTKEEEIKKAANLKLVPPPSPNGAHIGRTTTGKDVHSHARVGETGFNSAEHHEAANLHVKAAGANPKMAQHHNEKAKLHNSAAVSMKNREARHSANTKHKPVAPDAGKKVDKLHDPQLSGKVNYTRKSEVLTEGMQGNAVRANQKQERERRKEEAYPSSDKRRFDEHKINHSASNATDDQIKRPQIPNKQVNPVRPAAGGPKNNMLHNNLLAPKETMNKALEAGSGLAAPNTLTGGAALAKESLMKPQKSLTTIARPDKGFGAIIDKTKNPSSGHGKVIIKTEELNKGGANPANVPKDVKVKELQQKIDSGAYKPDSGKIADAMLPKPRPMKKSAAYMRAEDDYSKWEKREEFETFMKSRMPHMTKSEIRAFGQAMLLNKSMQLEKSLSDISSLSKAITVRPLGKLPSGKMLHSHFSADGHKDFTSEDHSHAAGAHQHRADTARRLASKTPGSAAKLHLDIADHHDSQKKLHENKSK